LVVVAWSRRRQRCEVAEVDVDAAEGGAFQPAVPAARRPPDDLQGQRSEGPLPDDWYRIVVLTAAVNAAGLAGDLAFLQRHLDDLRPLAGFVACAGSGGVVSGPVSLALARGEAALGNLAAARLHLQSAWQLSQRLRAQPWADRCLALRDALDRDDDV
jgi:hypothetical protein